MKLFLSAAIVFSLGAIFFASNLGHVNGTWCACFNTSECPYTRGCLVENGTCNATSCAFPKLCGCSLLCRMGNLVDCGMFGPPFEICSNDPAYEARSVMPDYVPMSPPEAQDHVFLDEIEEAPAEEEDPES